MSVRSLLLSVNACLLVASAGFGQGPGLVVVVGEPPEIVDFRVPENSPYQFDYDPARITLWDSIDMQNAITPGTVFQAGPAVPGCEVDLSHFASFQACFSGDGGGVAPGCDGFDDDGDNDIDLDDYTVFNGKFIGPVCNVVFVPVFVQGLAASTELGDSPVTLLTDPDGDDTFTVEAIQPVTVASIDIAPTSGALGTEMVVTLQPAIAPLAFDSSSTAQWSGIFNPTAGPASSPFDILYDPTQLRESSAASAILVAGDGSLVNPPDFASLELPGALEGSLTLHLGVSLSRSNSFTPTATPALWESITYDDTSLSTGAPMLAGQPSELEILLLSNDPDPTPDEMVLLQSYAFHLAAVMLIAENPTTLANAPAFVEVDLVTFNSAGSEIDRRESVRLDRVTGDDGDPSHLVYHSDLNKPIILVDVALDPGSYPNVLAIQAEGDGDVQIIPR